MVDMQVAQLVDLKKLLGPPVEAAPLIVGVQVDTLTDVRIRLFRFSGTSFVFVVLLGPNAFRSPPDTFGLVESAVSALAAAVLILALVLIIRLRVVVMPRLGFSRAAIVKISEILTESGTDVARLTEKVLELRNGRQFEIMLQIVLPERRQQVLLLDGLLPQRVARTNCRLNLL